MTVKMQRAAALVLLILIIPVTVFAVEVEGVQILAGPAFIFNGETVENSPAPPPMPFLSGISVPMTFTEVLYFEPGLRLYGTKVALITKDDVYKAVPAAIETADRVHVLNIELRPEIGAVFNLNENIMLGVTGAPVLTFRFAYEAFDDAEDGEDMSIVNQYYLSAVRYLSIYAGGFFSWGFADNMALRLKVGTTLPVYHIWDGDDVGFYDQLSIEPEIGFVFRF